MLDRALAYLETHRRRFLDTLLEYLRIPSVSAQRDHAEPTRRAGAFLSERIEEAGFETGLFEGNGLPTVHGERIEGEDRPTLIVYGHYDVQPPEPLDLWETPPFEPTIVGDGEIRARGCADDKGPSLALVFAAAWFIEIDLRPRLAPRGGLSIHHCHREGRNKKSPPSAKIGIDRRLPGTS